MIDTHCHLDLEPLVSRLPKLLGEAAAAGVSSFVVPAVHPDNWNLISSLAAEHAAIFPAFGVHPMHAGVLDDQLLGELSDRARYGIAIGETGIDPSYPVPLDVQEAAFREQLRLAVKLGLPALIHCRKAFELTLRVMREEKISRVGGIMHAFSGSPEMAWEFIRLGFVISISGTVTWQEAVKPVRLALETPLEHLVIETDAPDMSPEPYRRRFNRPVWLTETARRLSEIRNISFETVAAVTTDNARRILRVSFQ